jgi:hypothetical protein
VEVVAAAAVGEDDVEVDAPAVNPADQAGAEAVLTREDAVEPGSWPPGVASRGEARTWADLKGSCRERLRQEPSGWIPDISRGEKVGMCSAVLVDHGRVCSRDVLACWW